MENDSDGIIDLTGEDFGDDNANRPVQQQTLRQPAQRLVPLRGPIYDAGYDAGWDSGYDAGYLDGIARGRRLAAVPTAVHTAHAVPLAASSSSAPSAPAAVLPDQYQAIADPAIRAELQRAAKKGMDITPEPHHPRGGRWTEQQVSRLFKLWDPSRVKDYGNLARTKCVKGAGLSTEALCEVFPGHKATDFESKIYRTLDDARKAIKKGADEAAAKARKRALRRGIALD